MKKHSLAPKGLSLSQAQSISNLCYQRTADIENLLKNLNNVSKIVSIGGETYVETESHPIPENITELLIEKSKLHAAQAFLMENIRAKDRLLLELKTRVYIPKEQYPEAPEMLTPNIIEMVDEQWGMEQLSLDEYNEYLEEEAYAAHIGQFIHKDGTLTKLRRELPTIQTLQFIELEHGKKTPMRVVKHHTNEKLLEIHQELADIHGKHEQRVNYFKAKIKNLVTEKNAEINKLNAIEMQRVNSENDARRTAHRDAIQQLRDVRKREQFEFETKRQSDIQKTAVLRINVPARFKEIVDKYAPTKE